MFETWHKMIAMLQSGLDVRKVITHRLPAADFLSGFETMRRGECGKIVLDWSDVRPRRLRGEGLVAAARIRPLTIGDAAAAASLIREAFAAQSRATDPPSSALGERRRAFPPSSPRAAAPARRPTARWSASCCGRKRTARSIIGRLSAPPAWRGQGIARALLAAGEAEARRRGLKRMTLRVRLALGENQRLFAGFGFAPAGQGAHPGYRQPTFLLMEKFTVTALRTALKRRVCGDENADAQPPPQYVSPRRGGAPP